MCKQKARFSFTGTIFSKMLSGYIASTLLTVALIGVVSFFLIERYIVKSNQDDLLSKSMEVAQMASTPSGRMRTLTVSSLREIEALCDAQLIYIGNDMKARQPPPKRSAEGEESEEGFELTDIINAMDIDLFRSILSGTAATDVRRIEFMNKDVVFAGAPMLDDNGTVQGAIILYRPLTDIGTAVTSLISLEAIAGVSALLFAIAVAWVLSRYLTRPLSKLNAAAQRVAEGEYGRRADIRQRDEIGQLGDTLNLLSTRLKDVIDTLKDEKSKLQQILAGIGEGLIAVDLTGEVVHINMPALKLLELTDASLGTPTEKSARLLESLKGAIKAGERATETWTNTSDVAIEATLSPYFNEYGAPIGAVALLRDVSEPMRLEQMRRDYIANISHELRTPLTGIRGMTEPLIDGLMETEQERMDSYTIIYQETLRLERLIGEMLDISRLQDGRVALELEPMEPEGLIDAAMRRVMPRAAGANIAISFTPPENAVLVMGHEDRIIQVLTIFLDNALSFTPEGGKIELFVHRVENKAVFGVKDNGAGIDPSDLPYIWERFYKADKSRMGTSGTGLGLAIAKLIVELMGGEIGAESTLGEGATFTFALDIAE